MGLGSRKDVKNMPLIFHLILEDNHEAEWFLANQVDDGLIVFEGDSLHVETLRFVFFLPTAERKRQGNLIECGC